MAPVISTMSNFISRGIHWTPGYTAGSRWPGMLTPIVLSVLLMGHLKSFLSDTRPTLTNLICITTMMPHHQKPPPYLGTHLWHHQLHDDVKITPDQFTLPQQALKSNRNNSKCWIWFMLARFIRIQVIAWPWCWYFCTIGWSCKTWKC